MITVNNIERIYKKRIPAKFKRVLKHIEHTDEFQELVGLALKYNNPSDDLAGNNELYETIQTLIKKYGFERAKGIPMYWFCFVYINPLTRIEYLACKADQVLKSMGVKFRWV